MGEPGTAMRQPLIVSAAALIDRQTCILVQQRPPGKSMVGLWEFPGGKLEPGETPEAALVRELAEELGVSVAVTDLLPAAFVSEPLGDRQLILLLYVVRRWSGEPKPLHASALQWVAVENLALLQMPPADRPLVTQLAHLLA